jgi:GDPmannose 4,6-dehydratase
MRALIFGISGQDGSYLAEHLLECGYEVYGVIRRNSVTENQQPRVESLCVENMYGDLLDISSIENAIVKSKPDEIYNLAAQSHVRISFEIPQYTTQVNGLGVLNLLEAIRRHAPDAKFYQASSSEMFGNSVDDDKMQRETTPMHPVSPYGCSKLFAYSLVRNYRNSYKLFASNGVLYNHETLTYNTPLIVKIDDKIDILPIGDVVRFKTGLDFDIKKELYQEGKPSKEIEVWDKNGWTKVKYASGYPHKEQKNPRIINSRNFVYSATGSHVCILENEIEKKTKDLKIGDKVFVSQYPPLNQDSNEIISLEEAKFLGMMAGDGNLSKNIPKFTNKLLSVKEEIINLWGKIASKPKYKFIDSYSGFNKKELIGQVALFTDIKKEYDLYTNDISPFGHRNKKVPKCILNSSVSVMKEFLIGYNLCDGLKINKCKYHFKNFKTNSPTLAAGLLFLVSKVTGQKHNITIEESWKWGKQQFYYSINLMSDAKNSLDKLKIVSNLIDQGKSQREISRLTKISRSFIRKVQNKYIPNEKHHLELCSNEIKKIIEIPNYSGWFFDLETESGTFCAGVGTGLVHNSPRRGSNFVSSKIVKTAVAIKLGKEKELVLGNIDSQRDWGHSYDYVRAMKLILNHDKSDDFVVSTGVARSVRNLCEVSFSNLGLNYLDYLKQDEKFMRPEELNYLCGDSTKIRNMLGWKPTYTFESMIEEMIGYWSQRIK